MKDIAEVHLLILDSSPQYSAGGDSFWPRLDKQQKFFFLCETGELSLTFSSSLWRRFSKCCCCVPGHILWEAACGAQTLNDCLHQSVIHSKWGERSTFRPRILEVNKSVLTSLLNPAPFTPRANYKNNYISVLTNAPLCSALINVVVLSSEKKKIVWKWFQRYRLCVVIVITL